MTSENLQYCINNDIDIISTAIDQFGINDPLLSPLFKLLVKRNWAAIESYFVEANKITTLINKKPECLMIINTQRGLTYINRVREHAYRNLYNFVWG